MRYGQRKERTRSLDRSTKMLLDDDAKQSEGHGAAEKTRKQSYRSASRGGDGRVDFVSQYGPRALEQVIGIGPAADQRAQPLGFCERDLLAAFHRVVVAPYLRIDSVAQAESLVAELGDIFGVQLVQRRVYSSNRLEKAERNACVNSRGHLGGYVDKSGIRRETMKFIRNRLQVREGM